MTALQRLESLGLSLPTPPAAAGSYVALQEVEGILYVSGQLPMKDGKLFSKGKVGDTVSLEEAQEAARICTLNGLAILHNFAGLDNIRIIRVGGFVASANGFTDQPKVINGCSDLLVEVLGDRGKHARAAVGVAELPLGASVEVEFIACRI